MKKVPFPCKRGKLVDYVISYPAVYKHKSLHCASYFTYLHETLSKSLCDQSTDCSHLLSPNDTIHGPVVYLVGVSRCSDVQLSSDREAERL